MSVNGNLPADIDALINSHALVLEQFKAVAVTLAIAVAGSFILGLPRADRRSACGLQPWRKSETTGLDLTDHQEEGYII